MKTTKPKPGAVAKRRGKAKRQKTATPDETQMFDGIAPGASAEIWRTPIDEVLIRVTAWSRCCQSSAVFSAATARRIAKALLAAAGGSP